MKSVPLAMYVYTLCRITIFVRKIHVVPQIKGEEKNDTNDSNLNIVH